MQNLNDIIQDGFQADDPPLNFGDFALNSLEIGLKAYFSTYQVSKHWWGTLDSTPRNGQQVVDYNHPVAYREACTETILHLQHFVELVCKDLLRADHRLLADVAPNRNPQILHKLLHGQSLSTDEDRGIQSIEVSDALTRLCSLIDAGLLSDHMNLGFVKQSRQVLEALNTLRNRLWHRGTFILRYEALDLFIGGYVLPFVREVLAYPKYASYTGQRPYKPLACDIDPIDEIIACVRNGGLQSAESGLA